MDKIIKINDIEYIQKAEYDKAKRDVDTIKQLVSSSIADLSGFLSNQSIAQENKEEIKKEKEEYYSKRSKNLLIRVAGQRPYHIHHIDEEGNIYSAPQLRKLIFTIKDVFEVQKQYTSKTDRDTIFTVSEKLDIPVDTVHRIIYNIDIGTFTPFIKEYFSAVNNIKMKANPIETQNNPEKRKEMGL